MSELIHAEVVKLRNWEIESSKVVEEVMMVVHYRRVE